MSSPPPSSAQAAFFTEEYQSLHQLLLNHLSEEDAFPSPVPFIWSPMPEKPADGQAVEPNERHGWSVDFGVVRVDYDASISAQDRDLGLYPAPCIMFFQTARIPLASLYRPYGLRKEKTYFGSEDEEEYDF